MKSNSLAAVALFLAASVSAHEAPKHKHSQLIPIPLYDLPYGDASGDAAFQAATKFLAKFENETKAAFIFGLNAEERAGWSNLPAGIVRRTGISVAELSGEQRDLLFDFLASSLGAEGYENVMEVMAAEAFLSTDKRAARLKWDPENYWISFFGTPSIDHPWGWQFSGHHLALNLSINGNKVQSMSPTFVGTEPAIFTLDGIDYEAVVDMQRAGYAVFTALNAEQKKLADAGIIPEDVLTGAGDDGFVPPRVGLSASKMTEPQRLLLLAAIDEWMSIQPSENADPRMAEIRTELDQISYAWTGNDTVNKPTYMRIQGPSLIIELLSTGGNVGANAVGKGHYHTMYRNPKMDYGGVTTTSGQTETSELRQKQANRAN